MKSLRSIVRVMVSPSRVQPSGMSMSSTLLSETMDADTLIDEWLREDLAESPVRATSLGIDGYDDRLGDYSEAGFRRRDERDAHWTREFEALPVSIERDLL